VSQVRIFRGERERERERERKRARGRVSCFSLLQILKFFFYIGE
jgi:hypothetical protein